MFKAIGYVAFACLAACASPTPSSSYTLILDNSLSETTKEQVEEAASQWEVMLDHKLSFTILSQSCNLPSGLQGALDYGIGVDPKTLCVVASTGAYVDNLVGAPPGFTTEGYTVRQADIDSAITYLPMDRDGKDTSAIMVQIIAHELGHGMAMHHTQSGTIMCWDTSCASPAQTCDDVAQWSDIRGMSDVSKSCPKGGNYTLEH